MNAFKLWFFSLSIWTKQETHQTQSEGLDPPLAICKKGKGEDKDRKCVYRSFTFQQVASGYTFYNLSRGIGPVQHASI